MIHFSVCNAVGPAVLDALLTSYLYLANLSHVVSASSQQFLEAWNCDSGESLSLSYRSQISSQ